MAITWKNVVPLPYVGYGKRIMNCGLKDVFDEENGAYDGIMLGINFLTYCLGQPFTLKWYKKLHNATCDHLFATKIEKTFRRKSDEKVWTSKIYSKFLDDDALYRLKVAYSSKESACVERGSDGSLVITYLPKNRKTIKQNVRDIFANYNLKMDKPSDNDKLRHIYQLYRSLQMLHPFTDGNTRTNILVLQYALKQNGFPPVRMDYFLLNISTEEYGYKLLKQAVNWQKQ